jgi:hypothetical protein
MLNRKNRAIVTTFTGMNHQIQHQLTMSIPILRVTNNYKIICFMLLMNNINMPTAAFHFIINYNNQTNFKIFKILIKMNMMAIIVKWNVVVLLIWESNTRRKGSNWKILFPWRIYLKINLTRIYLVVNHQLPYKLVNVIY